jgi:hypothetical protein
MVKQAEHFHFTRSSLWMVYSCIHGGTCHLLVDFIATKFVLAHPNLSDDPIVWVYGMYNICITFDHKPARSFMAVVWIFISFGIMLHAILFDFHVKIYFCTWPVHLQDIMVLCFCIYSILWYLGTAVTSSCSWIKWKCHETYNPISTFDNWFTFVVGIQYHLYSSVAVSAMCCSILSK